MENARTTITMTSEHKLWNLLHAVHALGETHTNDNNLIEVVNADGMSMKIETRDNVVFYGKTTDPDSARKWLDNVPFERIVRMCMQLQAGLYDMLEEENEWVTDGPLISVRSRSCDSDADAEAPNRNGTVPDEPPSDDSASDAPAPAPEKGD